MEAWILALLGYLAPPDRSAAMPAQAGYSTGSCAVQSDAAAEMCARWERIARRLGLVGASCETRAQPITFAPAP